jgi:hypothetical protein
VGTAEIADAEHGNAFPRFLDDRAHDRRMGGHGTGAQIIAIGEAARHHDQIGFRQFALAVPDHGHRRAGHRFERHLSVAVAIGAGEDDDACLHASSSS